MQQSTDMCSGGQDLEIADVADLLLFAAQASYVVTLAGIPLRQMHQLSIGMHVARSYSLPVHPRATRYVSLHLYARLRTLPAARCRSMLACPGSLGATKDLICASF